MDQLSHSESIVAPEPSGFETEVTPTDSLVLSDEEIRVLGSLIEKSTTTPGDYPLTGNAVMRAANQSTSRFPVVQYEQRTVEEALGSLKATGYVRFVHMPSGRATTKYRHVLDEALGLDGGECAVLGLLMLRGPQTAGELKTRSERMHPFESLSDVSDALHRLADRSTPLVVLMERAPGQKEARWAHLLGGAPQPFTGASWASGAIDGAEGPAVASTSQRISELEDRVDQLEALVNELRAELGLASE